jgi:hypothetical protein
VCATGGQGYDSLADDRAIKCLNPAQGIFDIHRINRGIAEIGAVAQIEGLIPDTWCTLRAMVDKSRICRGPCRAPARLVVPPSQGTPIRPISTSSASASAIAT